MKKVKETIQVIQVIQVIPQRVYTPAPHPMQHRLNSFREIPSLVTTNTQHAPKGK